MLLGVLSGVTKYQMEELNVKPPADVIKRTADMIGKHSHIMCVGAAMNCSPTTHIETGSADLFRTKDTSCYC